MAGSAPSVPDTLATSLQSQLDFVSIDGMDPTLANGMKVYYEREVPFELRSQDSGDDDPQEVGALEAIKVRIVVSSDMETGVSGSAAPGVVVELSSESNLFFHYTHEMDSVRFSDVAQTQKLMVDYGEYPNVLLRMLNHCIKEPHTHLAVFVMKNDGKARLDFIQNMEYKFVELLSVEFAASDEETVRKQITYRYNNVKAKLALLSARLADVNALVKLKNPSLLLQLQRTPPRLPTGRRVG